MRAAELGQDSIALTDHGSMAAILKFYEEAVEHGIKPLLGIEGYFVEDIGRREKDDQIYHMGLIAKNNKGLQKLYKLSDVAWNQGFYKKPRFDPTILRKLGGDVESDLIALSGCLDGYVTHPLLNGDEETAKAHAQRLARSFKHFYIEVQPWNPSDVNVGLLKISDELGLPAVATLDAHYCRPNDKAAAEMSLLVQQSGHMKPSDKRHVEMAFEQSRKLDDLMERVNLLHPNRKIRFDKYDNYILSREDASSLMRRAGSSREDIFDNTLSLAGMAEAEIKVGRNYFPKFIRQVDSEVYLRDLAWDKLTELGLQEKEEYRERLRDELDIICRLGFADYMLVIWDMVNYARQKHIRTGPGRGSVGGSLLAYVLGVTRIDPLQHKLLFWRFLNMDIDYDVKFSPIKSEADSG